MSFNHIKVTITVANGNWIKYEYGS